LRASAPAQLLAPSDRLEVRQTCLPLGVAIETAQGNPLSDKGIWALDGNGPNGVKKLADLTGVFAEQCYRAKPSKERPFRNDLGSGARFGNDGLDLPASTSIIAVEIDDYEIITIDVAPPLDPASASPAVLALAMSRALPTTSTLRTWTRRAPTLEQVR
jgi:hypothetical protein